MSRLYVVRHGQAAAFSGDYDRLSPLGEKQSRCLGEYWAKWGLVFARVYVGPRRRHRQTHDIIASTYRRHGLAWPEPIVLPELDEFQSDQLIERALPELQRRDPSIGEAVATFPEGGERAKRAFGRIFVKITRMWVRGELNVPDVESWSAFRARVRAGVRQMIEGVERGRAIVAFTSGGPVAAAVGYALDLSDEKTLELSWIVRNAGYAEFLFSEGRFSLYAFNATPHLDAPDLLTYR
ncbi:MAG: histidine phosphatase family protein [Acidobacteria bacterium]|nr:MAG: histidine phosphatase family protein [Acidobacteriota bacterium]